LPGFVTLWGTRYEALVKEIAKLKKKHKAFEKEVEKKQQSAQRSHKAVGTRARNKLEKETNKLQAEIKRLQEKNVGLDYNAMDGNTGRVRVFVVSLSLFRRT